MRIRVKTTRVPEEQLQPMAAGELADEVVGGVLKRFRHRIEDVVLHVTHAPSAAAAKGAVCRIGARLRGGVVLRAESAAHSVESAMRQAASRLRRRVRRLGERSADLRRRPYPVLN